MYMQFSEYSRGTTATSIRHTIEVCSLVTVINTRKYMCRRCKYMCRRCKYMCRRCKYMCRRCKYMCRRCKYMCRRCKYMCRRCKYMCRRCKYMCRRCKYIQIKIQHYNYHFALTFLGAYFSGNPWHYF